MITDDEICERIVHTLPDGVRLTAVMDSCHSGTGAGCVFCALHGTGFVADYRDRNINDVF